MCLILCSNCSAWSFFENLILCFLPLHQSWSMSLRPILEAGLNCVSDLSKIWLSCFCLLRIGKWLQRVYTRGNQRRWDNTKYKHNCAFYWFLWASFIWKRSLLGGYAEVLLAIPTRRLFSGRGRFIFLVLYYYFSKIWSYERLRKLSCISI